MPITSMAQGVSLALWRMRALCGSHAAGMPMRAMALSGLLLLSSPWNAELLAQVAGPQRATREELQQRVTALEGQLAGTSLKGEARNRSTAELAGIRIRLQQGDFRVGDRFIITIKRDSIRADTASVRDSLKVALLNLPDISLAGVLRSELDKHMTDHAARFLRNVSVQTNVLTRISVVGEVSAPGYYLAAPDRPISEVIMLAGGPATEANLKELSVTRSGSTVVNSKDSRKYLKEGRTLEQLDIQSGDEVRIPKKKKISGEAVLRIILMTSTMAFTMLNFLMWYYRRQDEA